MRVQGAIAVCIRCGTLKRHSMDVCPACRFKPRSNEEKAQSLILSMDYEIDGIYRGKTREELSAIAEEISSGREYVFDKAEVKSVIHYAEQVQGISPAKLAVDGVRWLLPPILLLIGIYVLLYLS